MSQVWLGKTEFIQKIGAAVAASITAAILLLAFAGPDVLLRLENASVDGRFVVRGPRPAATDIVLSQWTSRAYMKSSAGRGHVTRRHD